MISPSKEYKTGLGKKVQNGEVGDLGEQIVKNVFSPLKPFASTPSVDAFMSATPMVCGWRELELL